MAALKDSIVSGSLRVTDTTYTDTIQAQTIKAPTTSGGDTYGAGTSGQVIKSNGTTSYWDNEAVTDVQVDGASIVSNTIATIPKASGSSLGLVSTGSNYGLTASYGTITIYPASSSLIKNPSSDSLKKATNPITPSKQHEAVFYGLATAAGSDMSSLENEVGTYTDEAKAAICAMIGADSESIILNLLNATIRDMADALIEAKNNNKKILLFISDGRSGITITEFFEITSYHVSSGTHSVSQEEEFEAYFETENKWGTITLEELEDDDTVSLVDCLKPKHITINVDSTDVALGTYEELASIGDLSHTQVDFFIDGKKASVVQYVNWEYNSYSDSYSSGYKIIVNNYLRRRVSYLEESPTIYWLSEVLSDEDTFEDIAFTCKIQLEEIRLNSFMTIAEAYNALTEHGDFSGEDYRQLKRYISNIYYNDLTAFSMYEANGGSANSTIIIKFGPDQNGCITQIMINGPSSESTNALSTVTTTSYLVKDVQINGTSAVSSGVVNIPLAAEDQLGVVKVGGAAYGLAINEEGRIYTVAAQVSHIKAGNGSYRALTAPNSHAVAFYGLAKAAGDTTQASSENAVGTYTDTAKTAIRSMIGAIGNTDYATSSTGGVVKINNGNHGLTMDSGVLKISSNDNSIKSGLNSVIPVVASNEHQAVFYGLAKAAGSSMSSSDNAIGTYTDDAKTAIRSMIGAIGTTDYATSSTGGVVKTGTGTGIYLSDGVLTIREAYNSDVKTGTSVKFPITPGYQHNSVFYGLAKAAGDTTQSASSNAIGTYTTAAKSAIQTMLGVDIATIGSSLETHLVETITSTTPSITGQPNMRYMCSEVSSISITPPATGSVDVIFTSGTTPAVLTVPNTVKFPEWFDATSLDTNTTYEILITDGVYGSVMTWAV